MRTNAFTGSVLRKVKASGSLVLIGIYVDDIVLATDTKNDMQQIKESLCKRFDMTDLGEVKHILGIEVKRQGRATFLSQAKYTQDVLQKFGMQDCKAASTPREVNEYLIKQSQDALPVDKATYQSLVGSLMYLMLGTRPDIANAVGAVAQHCSNPGKEHWIAGKRILRYLKGTADHGIWYGKPGATTELFGYTDADWAGDKNDRKSTSGNVFLFGGGPISWSAKKQTAVALSTAEAEYVAAAHAVQEVIWLRQLFESLQVQQLQPTVLFVDNQAAIALGKNPVFHARTKHVDIKVHFVREEQSKGVVDLRYCTSQENVADIFTKGVSKEVLERHRSALAIRRQGETVECNVAVTCETAVHRKNDNPEQIIRPGQRKTASVGRTNPWFLFVFVLGVLLSGGQANQAKQYQYCGGKRQGVKMMSLKELGEFQTYVYISPTIAVRLHFNRTDIAAFISLVGLSNSLVVWNCSRVNAIDKYPNLYPDIADDNRFHPVPIYKPVVLVDTNETLFVNAFDELVQGTPYSWSYVTRNNNNSDDVEPDTRDEKQFFKFLSDPVFDGELIRYHAAIAAGSQDGVRSLAAFAIRAKRRCELSSRRALPVTQSTETKIGEITKYLLNGNIQLLINSAVVLIVLYFICRIAIGIYSCIICLKSCVACCERCITCCESQPPMDNRSNHAHGKSRIRKNSEMMRETPNVRHIQ